MRKKARRHEGTEARRGRGPALAATLATLAMAGVAFGQSRQVPAPPQNDPVVIHSATVHTVSGDVLENAYVVFEDGRITAVGQGIAPRRAESQQLDATDLHVYPGLIASRTQLGLTEVGAVDVTQDHTEFGRVTPEVRAGVAINPDSDLLPVARANGILTALVFPQGGLVAGRCSTMRLDGWRAAAWMLGQEPLLGEGLGTFGANYTEAKETLMAQGVPEEFIEVANAKLATINAAYESVQKERGFS